MIELSTRLGTNGLRQGFQYVSLFAGVRLQSGEVFIKVGVRYYSLGVVMVGMLGRALGRPLGRHGVGANHAQGIARRSKNGTSQHRTGPHQDG